MSPHKVRILIVTWGKRTGTPGSASGTCTSLFPQSWMRLTVMLVPGGTYRFTLPHRRRIHSEYSLDEDDESTMSGSCRSRSAFPHNRKKKLFPRWILNPLVSPQSKHYNPVWNNNTWKPDESKGSQAVSEVCYHVFHIMFTIPVWLLEERPCWDDDDADAVVAVDIFWFIGWFEWTTSGSGSNGTAIASSIVTGCTTGTSGSEVSTNPSDV